MALVLGISLQRVMGKINKQIKRILPCIILLMSGFICADNGYSQVVNDMYIPVLNEHKFAGSNLINNPFIKSSLDLEFGVATTQKLNFPITIGDSVIFGLEGESIFAHGGFKYRQKIKDWLAFHTELAYKARLGTETGGLVFQGVNTMYSFNIGWMFRILQTNRSYLSGGFEIRNNEGAFMDIAGWIQDIIDRNPNASITKKVPALNAGMGGYFSHAFNDLWGFTVATNIGYGESLRRGKERWMYRAGFSVDFDLSTRTNIPIGSSLSGLSSNMPELVWSEEGTLETISWKIAYTGSDDFIIGLVFYNSEVPFEKLDRKTSTLGTIIDLSFYFN